MGTGTIFGFLRKCLFRALSAGPIPSHVAFIMDGNRRYAKRRNLVEGDGHRAGFSSLMTILGYCYDLGIRLQQKAMKATASNDKTVPLICVAYTSRNEIERAIPKIL
ncbi:hypothetical protein NL676_006484 [Syzygium grande]|nr:hypothetical protein NL676_006484 [Syzygium grande]